MYADVVCSYPVECVLVVMASACQQKGLLQAGAQLCTLALDESRLCGRKVHLQGFNFNIFTTKPSSYVSM